MNIQIAGGSIIGTDHSKPGKPGAINNHDAFNWKYDDDLLVAMVADGCGSGKNSEVGSKIGVRILTNTIFNEMKLGNVCLKNFWQRVRNKLLSHISILSESMGESLSEVINNYFLFTIVGVIVTPEESVIFSFGDGVFSLNGKVTEIGPFPRDEPPYLAYNLTGSSVFDTNPEYANFCIHEVISTSEVSNIMIGTDGVVDLINANEECLPGREQKVGDISQFFEDIYFSNQDMVRRRLAMINREKVVEKRIVPGLLKDDTTMIVIQNLTLED